MSKKEKKCFVIMPISDNDDYPEGHFGRVYQFIIKPACLQAGFIPIRADEIMTTNYIAIDIIKHIIDSEMAICDLSSRNPNVLYELGIRQAFNLPVTLIKDIKTTRIFDIQGFRDIEYDDNLRIDNVNSKIEELSQVIVNTYNNTTEINSLVSLLSIEPAKLGSKKEISLETELILNSLLSIEKKLSNHEIRLQSFIPKDNTDDVRIPLENLSDYLKQNELSKLSVNDIIYHDKFGKGTIIEIKGAPINNKIIVVKFEIGIKQIMLQFAKLRNVL